MRHAPICPLLLAAFALPLPAEEPKQPSAAMIEAARRFMAIEEEWDKSTETYLKARREAKTDAQRVEAERLRPDPAAYSERCLKLPDEQPDTWGGLAALYWVARHGGPERGRAALARLLEGPVANADLGRLHGLLFLRDSQSEVARALVKPIYDRVARDPGHARAADLLVWAYLTAAGDPDPRGVAHRAGDLLASKHPDARYLWRFCEKLRNDPDPAWAEGHLRAALKREDAPTRVAASFALATVLQNKDEASQPEAEALYRAATAGAAGAEKEWRRVTADLRESILLFPSEGRWADEAKTQLAEMKARGLGRPAPALAGDDLDGKPLKLSDRRGKVVLVSYWASWCAPCVALVPRERALADALAKRPFALIGVNGDEELDAARKGAAEHRVAWPSLRGRGTAAGNLAEAWGVSAWPTLYLVDHKGVIRKRWVGAPPEGVMEREAEKLVAAAERGE